MDASPLDRVLGFIRILEAGGGAAQLRPFLAASFVLVEAAHLLAPEGSTRRARTSSVFEVRDGLIVSQDSYDCYYR